MDIFGEMIELLNKIKNAMPGTDSDIIEAPAPAVMDAFIKLGIMYHVAAGTDLDSLQKFVKQFYVDQLSLQDKV